MAARIVVLASGSGSLFQALLDAQADNKNYEIVALVSDQPNAYAILRAAKAGLPIAIIATDDFADRAAWNQGLFEAVQSFNPDWIVSAGFMRILAEPMVSEFAGKIINTHPALLPNFPGAHAVRDAILAKVTETGSTVHFVDSGVDTGPIIVQAAVAVLPSDDESALHERIKVVERNLLVQVVSDLGRGRYQLVGREVIDHDS